MIFWLDFFLFLLGAIVGSFLNVVILRSEKGEKITGRSYCPHCHKKLSWWELIPILSFFILRGRCLKCKAKISWQYPLVEFFTGLVFVLIFWRFSQFNFFLSALLGPALISNFLAGFLLFLWLFYSAVLIVIFVYDLRQYLILDNVLTLGLIGALVFQVFYGFLAAFNLLKFYPPSGLNFLGPGFYLFFKVPAYLSPFLGALFYFLVLGLLAYGTKGRAMGYGDPKLGLFLGLILGWPASVVALALSFLLGGLVGGLLISLKKKGLKSYLPFGPFLVLGCFLTIFFGDIILKGYLSLFG